MSLGKTLLAGGALLALSACNLAPDYQPPHLDLPPAFKEAGGAPWQPAQPADQVTRGPWWTAFNDPVLNGLEDRIEAANPTLAVALARYDESRADAAAVSAGLLPRVDGTASLTNNRQSKDRPLRGAGQRDVYGSNTVGASASYEIDLWGKVRNQVAAGRATAQASAADLASVRLGLQAELASDYFALRGLDERAHILADTVTAYEKQLSLTQTMFQGNIVAGMDVSRAETQLDSARSQVSQVASQRAQMEHAIAALVGAAPAQFSLAPVRWTPTLPAVPTGLPSTLLQRRPDVAAAERDVLAANAGIGVARAAYYPDLSLQAVGGFQDTGFNLLKLPMAFWSVGPGITLPLFEGGRLDAGLAKAVAQHDEASAKYRETVLNAFREVEDNLAAIRWLGAAAKDEDAGTLAAQRTLDMATNLYRDGADSYLEVVTAQTALLEAQQSSLDLHTRQVQADVALIRALGGGWSVEALPSDNEATRLPDQATKAP
ncbi:efflux transporter outer membrane subunit [Nitrospirillum pindoramense]|uniref:NodT family efflux transporter outer membrane factor (OMF) lipoprotein n=1 Tax=Nitrospirillum amazonense TaxID=28077 RepID=A0A560GSC6_9PROT|nr:efflux transporter outer membrane subunit [Nitrospirillum amazonense]TWB36539.1 NodT family efflux transporter outer membrane factor (OMF) lipoprotein [Nitrospirillum amazonense]